MPKAKSAAKARPKGRSVASSSRSELDKIEAKELHKRVVRKFQRRPVIVNGVDDVWAADLVDMSEFAKANKGNKWILTVIDVLSRYAWAVPMKNKTGAAVMDAITTIITESNRQPNKIWVDQGKEFLNKEFQKNFDKVYHTFGEMKASSIERFNRTLKEKMWYKFTKHDSEAWVGRLPRIMSKYNNTKHSSIAITPYEAAYKDKDGNKVFEEYLLNRQAKKIEKIKSKTSPPHLKIGDVVRLAIAKDVFRKGYRFRWSDELFRINGVFDTKPTTYSVEDEKGELVQGTFYEEELQKSAIPMPNPYVNELEGKKPEEEPKKESKKAKKGKKKSSKNVG